MAEDPKRVEVNSNQSSMLKTAELAPNDALIGSLTRMEQARLCIAFLITLTVGRQSNKMS
jgi:hypothetical protein